MGLYERYVLPHVIAWSCGSSPIRHQRRKVVPRARGRVLEVGMGSGHNLAHYDAEQVEVVYGLEPSVGMRAQALPAIAAAPVPVQVLEQPGEAIPLSDDSVDTVVLTFTLCSIVQAGAALAQMRRVLRPDGLLLFCEHGQAPDGDVQRWQRLVEPVWSACGGGCRLTRPIPTLIQAAGFRIQDLETMYLPNTPRFAGFNYWGSATP